ncbi:type VI secretion system Vgr family protein [Hyunsoonleella rubra]|uniref:Type VI secretion system Vgr family protein n=1 Tax=Hyunsoonleella rubra TaxID=1737062 RepID=A0ABW5TBB0_9FLAO
MAILSKTDILINGSRLNYYTNCSLFQEIGEHHMMEVHCMLETIQNFCNSNSQEIDDLLGAVITIETKSYADIDFHGELKFKGIITGLSYRKGLNSSEGDFVIIKATSPTILADDGPHNTSYTDMSFVDIMEENFNGYDKSKLEINTSNSKLSEPLSYTVQYNESCFNFAKRMAARNGEWIYYNGEELVFGIDKDSDELNLVLGRDLMDFNTSLTPMPQNFNYYTNDYLTNNIHLSDSSSASTSSEGSFGVVNDKAKEIFTKPTQVWINISDDSESKNRIDSLMKLQQESLQSNQIKVSGTSDNPGVMLASTIKISNEVYRVIRVTHAYSGTGDYENYFEAISVNIDTYPKTNVNAFPIAYSQTAKVIENHDPEGMGRIKVQLPWQQPDGLTTPWIRYLAPSASPGQGFFFIPEIDDEVMVDFEGGNAECPYAMGGLFNSDATPPEGSSNSNNYMKILQGKSGALFKINDEDGSITIQDKAGSSIVMDGSGDIVITAAESLMVTAGKEVSTSSSEDTLITSGKKIEMTSSDKASVVSGKDVLIEGAVGVTIKDSVKIDINAPNVASKADIGLKLEGTTVDVNGKATTNVKGGLLNLNC